MAGRLPESVIEPPEAGLDIAVAVYLRDMPDLRQWLATVPKHEIVAKSALGR